jgi:hypothetical protein
MRQTMDREVPKLMPGATLLVAHWRHPVSAYPSPPTEPTTSSIDVFEKATPTSVAVRTGVPGAHP